eukprot:4002608-Amphidinium_carterae.1
MRAEDSCICGVDANFNSLGQHLDRGTRDRNHVPRCGELGGTRWVKQAWTLQRPQRGVSLPQRPLGPKQVG